MDNSVPNTLHLINLSLKQVGSGKNPNRLRAKEQIPTQPIFMMNWWQMRANKRINKIGVRQNYTETNFEGSVYVKETKSKHKKLDNLRPRSRKSRRAKSEKQRGITFEEEPESQKEESKITMDAFQIGDWTILDYFIRIHWTRIIYSDIFCLVYHETKLLKKYILKCNSMFC